MFIHYNDLYGHTLTQELMKFTIMVDHSLVIITLYRIFCLTHALVLTKREEILHFHYVAFSLYGHALAHEPLPWGSLNSPFW